MLSASCQFIDSQLEVNALLVNSTATSWSKDGKAEV